MSNRYTLCEGLSFTPQVPKSVNNATLSRNKDAFLLQGTSTTCALSLQA